ncbi:MAG: efflux transporter outer membrane subunit [Janthinobacterium lividum]
MLAAPVALALTLSACTVGPEFHWPEANAPAAWPAQPAAPSMAVAAEVDEKWWDTFADPELSSLVNRLVRQNLDLAVAAERIQQARAQRRVTRAAGLPQVGVREQYTHERLSPNGVISLFDPSPGAPLEVDDWTQALTSSWELDLFGKVRRAVEAADANTAAAAEARRAIALDLVAELAGNYIELRGVQARETIAADNLKTAQRTLAVVKDRFANGLGTNLDVARAQGQVESIAATLPTLHTRRMALINAMGVLLAAQPRALEGELGPVAALPGVPPKVPVGLPGDLMRRRPDIREAEAALHAATAETGVAVADFYPDISLTGQFGTDGLQFGNLWSVASRAFSLGPSITLPLFQGGRLKGTLELRKSQQREAALAYQKTVIQALNDADNALTAYADIQQRRDRLAAEVEQDRIALAAAEANYRQGSIGLLSVTTAQADLLRGEDQLAQSETGVRQNLVALYKALGGGWKVAN